MKNITVLAVLVIIAGASSANNPAHCQDLEKEGKLFFSIGPQYGFVYGQALEFVYPHNTKGEFLSELKWDMKPVFYTGVRIAFGRTDDLYNTPGFFSTASFKAGFGGDSGFMEDRDWQSIENDALTSFSRHTNTTRELYWLDITAGASLPVKNFLYIKPFFSGSWMRFSFSGRDGWGKYARGKETDIYGSPETFYPIECNPVEYSYKGRHVINYVQNWFLAAAGFSIGTKILYPFSFDLFFQISPLTYCAAKDEHLTTKTTYHDFTGWGLFIEPGGSFSFTAQRIEFLFDFNYRYIGKTRGKSYMRKEGEDQFFRIGESGAGLSLADARFLVIVKL